MSNRRTSNGSYPTSNAPSPSNSHHSQSPHSSYPNTPQSPSFATSQSAMMQLHGIARNKCLALLPFVFRIIKRHIVMDNEGNGSELFKWDSGLVRDGCFFAAFLFAGGEGELQPWPEEGGNTFVEQKEGVDVCLRALREMQWSFSKSEERDRNVRMIWDVESRERSRRQEMNVDHGMAPYGHPQGAYDHHTMQVAPIPPSLSSNSRIACNPVDHGGTGNETWSTYTPPGSATSVSNSSSTGSPGGYVSLNGQCMNRFKSEPAASSVAAGGGDFYVGTELDHFTYSVPVGDGHACSDPNPNPAAAYALRQEHERHPSSSMQPNMSHGYLDPAVVFAAPVAGEEAAPCPQFAQNCHGFYH
jgi:hypothetical protein